MEDAIADGRFKPVLAAFETLAIPILAICPSKRYLPARVRRLIDLMTREWARPRRAEE